MTATRLNQKDTLIETGTNINAFASPQQGMQAYAIDTTSIFVAGNWYYYDGAWFPRQGFRGTGAQIAALVTNNITYPGLIVFCTADGSGFTKGEIWKRNANDDSWDQVHPIPTDSEVYPHSTTIGDYAAPIDAHASSNGSTSITMGTTGNQQIDFTLTNVRLGELITDTAKRNTVIRSVTVRIQRSGSPAAGNVTATIKKLSDNSLVATSNEAIDGQTMSTSDTDYTFTFGSATAPVISPNENFYIYIEFAGGTDSSNTIYIRRHASNSYAGGVWVTLTTQTSTADLLGNFVTNNANLTMDNNTGTLWQSASEVNPWLRLELSGSADKEPAAIAIWLHANNTSTQFKVETSPDGSAWTQRRLINVSDAGEGAYAFIRMNRDIAQMRYVRIMATDGGAVVLAVAEAKLIVPTESQWNRRHGHQPIDPALATVGLAG